MGDIIKNLHDAKSELSSLVERAANGEEIIITKNGKPRARLVRFESTKGRRMPGCGKGRIWIAGTFDDPLPEDILATLEEPIRPARHAPVAPEQSKPAPKGPRRNPRR